MVGCLDQEVTELQFLAFDFLRRPQLQKCTTYLFIFIYVTHSTCFHFIVIFKKSTLDFPVLIHKVRALPFISDFRSDNMDSKCLLSIS